LNKSWYSHCQRVTDKNYIEIYSTATAFAALKADSSVTAWGDSGSGGSDAPAGSGYTKIYSTFGAFASLKTDGSIEPSALRAAKAESVE
jgi:hypothetical protein